MPRRQIWNKLAGLFLVCTIASCGGGSSSGTEPESAAGNASEQSVVAIGDSINSATSANIENVIAVPSNSVEEPEIDSDGDGVTDNEDVAPLNASCATEEDQYNGVCLSKMLTDATRSTVTDDGRVLFTYSSPFGANSYEQLVTYDLNEEKFVSVLDTAPYMDIEDSITSLSYSNSQNRLYFSLSSGVIYYYGDNGEVNLFSEIAGEIVSLTEAGEDLWVQAKVGSFGNEQVSHIILDHAANIVNSSTDVTYRSAVSSTWSEAQGRIFLVNTFDLISYQKENTTFLLDRRIEQSYGLNERPVVRTAPLVISPDGNTIITSDFGIIDDRNRRKIFRFFLESSLPGQIASRFIWDEQHGLLTLSSHLNDGLYDSVLTSYNADYSINEVHILPGFPLQLYVNEGTATVLTSDIYDTLTVYERTVP